MATRFLLRTLPRSFTNSSFLLRSRPITAISAANLHHSVAAATTNVRTYSTRQTTSSLNDSNPNWSNRPPKETILLDGCDFEHWLVVVEKPEGEPTRDEIIDSYINTLAKVVGSYDEAKMKIYSVSTRCYFAFGALVTEELSYKLKELPGVRWVLPDSYLDVKNKDYGGEPFIDGKAVPYDPKYHEEWIRNNARANERNRRNDRPRNFDRSRNFERRRENMQTSRGPPNMGGPPPNSGDQQMLGGPPANSGGQQMLGGPPPSNMGEGIRGPPPPNMEGRPQGGNNWNSPPPQYGGGPPANMGGGMPPNNNMGGMRPHNMGGANSGGQQMLGGPPPSNMGGPPPNMGEGMGDPPPSNMGGRPQGGNNWNGPPPQYGVAPPPNMGEGMGGPPPSNMGGRPQGGNNWNGPPPQYGVAPPPNMGGGMPPNNNMGGMRPHNMGGGMPNNAPNYQQQQQGQYGPNSGGMPYQSGPAPNNYPPNVDGGNPYQKQDVPGRDMPPAANYE